jgi:RimJ/RimL family protein N-acetyltransferase
MAELNIRQATLADIPQLAELKSTYVRSLYRGFISQDILNSATLEHYSAAITTWMESGRYRVALMERDGKIGQYLVYGDNPEEPFNGLIYEGVCDHLTTTEEKRALVNYGLNELRSRSHTTAYLWILVDNFRVRYLFETLGFRPDGTKRTQETFGQELHIARYQYKL